MPRGLGFTGPRKIIGSHMTPLFDAGPPPRLGPLFFSYAFFKESNYVRR
jgi:hypothetical protein